jgi:ABC-type sugar transport system permease subunit
MTRLALVARTPRPGDSYRAREIRVGWLLMQPSLVVPFSLSLVFLAGIYVTLNNWRLTTENTGFVGLANYLRVLAPQVLALTGADPGVHHRRRHNRSGARDVDGDGVERGTARDPLLSQLVSAATCDSTGCRRAGLEGAVSLRHGRLRKFPALVSRSPDAGFLGAPWQALYSLVEIDVCLNLPFIATILSAGLQTLPQEPLEAPPESTAPRRGNFLARQATMLVPYYVVALLFRVIDSINVFDTICGTTSGGPGDTTRVLSINAYVTTFPFFSLSSGLTVFIPLWIICVLIGMLLYRRFKALEAF